ncbi:hypothetical protein ACH5RR_012473 [Cinchona calisaya]|uniref:Large ribosomal RNA subunit accumulation protein YCED homolog 1, chloroplastic n=1 Tax=Cinchona calisaya TaxID=153742 RepID=A0ABD3A7W3_9GENT
MPLHSSFSIMPSNIIPVQFCSMKLQNGIVLHRTLNFFPCKSSNNQGSPTAKTARTVLLNKLPITLKLKAENRNSKSSNDRSYVTMNRRPTTLKLRARNYNSSDFLADQSMEEDFEWDGQECVEIVEDEEESLWEGAVIYRRNASISHVEYCTTLERLGLGKLSTGISKSHALELGLRVTKGVKDYPDGTPVLISIDVMRKKQKLRLDGIIKTVLALDCNRCGESAAKSIFENFSLLLTEESFEESETINMGIIYGEEKFRRFGDDGREEDDDLVDFDDQLYFPPEDKEIDISKHIRDLLHVEITIDAICDPKCKGICLRCGTNLNKSSCNCKMQNADSKHYGPLGSLRTQMQRN